MKGLHNSLVVFYTNLYIDLYLDVTEQFQISATESNRDVKEILHRVSYEGLSFLTVNLPRLGKALDSALLGVTPFSLEGFQKKPNSQLPKFFGELLKLVFVDSGHLRDQPDLGAIRALRQLAYYLYKLETPIPESKTQKVLDSFVAVDEALAGLNINADDQILETSRRFTSAVFGAFDHAEVVPRHGPGAVATGEGPAEKQDFKRLYKNIEKVYPFTEYFQYSLMHVADNYRNYEDLDELEDGTAKVVLVPKDSRGPRLISCEPLEYQWIQQGIGRKIVRHLERHRLTSGHVNFTDQTINRHLALEGSKTQEWVTLDMKEASDRVSLQLVETLFAYCPSLLEALKATRSSSTCLPDGRTVKLNKFAPMGSNLCFPVEAFVFYSLAVSAIMYTYGIKRREALKSVYVYGDDLIVRSKVYAAVLQHLPTFGLMFNDGKCCTSGFFRESCGCDAYKGVDVTPLRMKKVWKLSRTVDPVVVTSYIALSNACYARGYFRVAKRLKDAVENAKVVQNNRSVRIGQLPITSKLVGGWTWIRDDVSLRAQPPGVKVRLNNALQRLEVRVRRIESKTVRSASNAWCTVLRRLSTSGQGTEPGVYAVPHRSYPKWGWSEVV